MKKNNCIFSALILLLSVQLMFAQPLTLKNTWDGQFDIKMVGSMVLQPAFVNMADSYSPVDVTGFVTDDIMRRTFGEFNINNRYSDFPTTTHLLPLNVKNGCSITDPCIPNALYTCPSTATTGLRYKTIPSSVALVYADCDDDQTTFQSSWAYLDLGEKQGCTTVQAAYLYWAAQGGGVTAVYNAYKGTPTMKSFPGGAVGNIDLNTYKTVKLKGPGDSDYANVTASTAYPEFYSGYGEYICVADVTKQMQGEKSGNFWVANIQSTSKATSLASGWCLVVVFTPPNCPTRHIVLYDGKDDRLGNDGKHIDIPITGLKTPSSSDFKSYLGFAALDGENTAPNIQLSSLQTKTVTKLDGNDSIIQTYGDIETLDFQAGGKLVSINPFATDQPWYRFADKYGAPYTLPKLTRADLCSLSTFDGLNWIDGIDGVSSSRITTYDEVTNKNGNEIIRMPNLSNTLGLDAHHFRLPQGAITQGDTQATMTVYSGEQGGTVPFLAYIAIETIQPSLKLTKTSSISAVALDQEIEYTIKVENGGGIGSLADAYILDTLDFAVDFVPGSVQYLYGKTPPQPYQHTPIDVDNEVLKFYLPEIQPALFNEVKDSVVITFKVKVKDITRQDIWQCIRVIKNKAVAYFHGVSSNPMIETESNFFNCTNEGRYADVNIEDTQLSPVDMVQSSSKEPVTLCKGETLSSTRAGFFISPPAYLWSNGSHTPSIVIQDNYGTQNTYWVQTSSDCKVYRDTFLVSVVLEEIPSKVAVSLCKGETLSSTRGGSFVNTPTYLWSNGSQASSIVITDNYGTQNTYWVQTSSDCKVYKDTFLVSVAFQEASSKIAVPLCKEGTLVSPRVGFVNTPSYLWSNGSITSSIVIPDDYGTQNTYWVQTSSDCKLYKDTFLISIPAKIENTLVNTIDKICRDAQTNVTLTATQTGPVNTSKWQQRTAGGSWVDMTPQPLLSTTVSPTETTEYKFISEGSCEQPEKVVTIDVNPPFTVQLTASSSAVPLDEPFDLTATVIPSGTYNYTWSLNLPQLNQSTNSSVSTSGGLQTYSVTVKDLDAVCSGEAETTVTVDRLPTAITPNNDGFNDKFADGYAIVVFNRIGQVVYDSSGAPIGWDGKVNGAPANPGIYYFIINGTIKGTIEVVKR